MKKEKVQANTAGISKVVVSTGLGRLRQVNAQFDDKVLPDIVKELSAITGQKPAVRKAKKSIAGFKVRQNETVGLMVTLRGKRKDDFLVKLANIVLPRLRDFRGISAARLDRDGNLNIGFKDQSVFPEINPESSKWSFGLEVTIVAKEKKPEEAIDFYRQIGIPLTVA